MDNCVHMKVDIEALERVTTSCKQKNGWRVRERTLHSKRVGKRLDFEYQGVMAKAPPCSERTLKTPLPLQSSLSSREEEGQWVSVEDRRRRRAVFEETAKRMLRYREDSEDLKVGVTELQKQLGISEETGLSIKQIAQQASNENAKRFLKFLGKVRDFTLPWGLTFGLV